MLKECCEICECEHTKQYPYCAYKCKVFIAYTDDPVMWKVNFNNRRKKDDGRE